MHSPDASGHRHRCKTREKRDRTTGGRERGREGKQERPHTGENTALTQTKGHGERERKTVETVEAGDLVGLEAHVRISLQSCGQLGDRHQVRCSAELEGDKPSRGEGIEERRREGERRRRER